MRSRSESGATMEIAGPCIVDLCASSEEDDDDDVVFLAEFPAHLSHRASSRKLQTDAEAAAVNNDLVILEEIDKTIELHFGAGGVEKESQKSSQNSSVVLDDDCCILDEDPLKLGMVKTSCGDDSDDLVMTGEVGQVACRDFPHARHLCVQFPFKTTAHIAFCSQCHCYVCDMLAPCSLWGDGTRGGDHCHASDKIGERWKLLRQYNKSHPTGCSDPSTLQQLLSPGGNSSAGKSDSGAQRCSYPAGYEHLLVQSKEFVAQCFSDLFSSEGESIVSKFFGALASTSNSRGFSQSQPVNTGNNESTSFRGLLGCPTGDSARSQYQPLQIALNRPNRDVSSHARRHHSQVGGVQSKLHRYVQRKDHRISSMYRSYQSEGGGGCHQPRRIPRKNGSFYTHPPRSSSNPSSIQRAQAAVSVVLGRHVPSPTTAEQNSFGGTVPDGNAVLSEDFLVELADSQTLLPLSHYPVRTEELRQQFLNVESASVCPDLSFGNANPLSQNEADAYYSKGDGTVLVDSQSSRGSENRVEGGTNSLPTSSPTLLADYLLNADDFWGDLPENFV